MSDTVREAYEHSDAAMTESDRNNMSEWYISKEDNGKYMYLDEREKQQKLIFFQSDIVFFMFLIVGSVIVWSLYAFRSRCRKRA